MKWTAEVSLYKIQESQLLKELRTKYDKNAWEMIAKDLNSSPIIKTVKTGRQCRDKYINCCKFDQDHKENQTWTEQESKKLYELYMYNGGAWSDFE